jgi:GT2 family glycosyltransferase
MSRLDVWAVVLNHHEVTDTLGCLQSLKRIRHRRLTVIVVDNASGAGEVAWLRSAGATVLESGGNLGYAGGNNVGVRAALDAGADAVWLLNPDARPHPAALRRMLRVLERHRDVGIVGGRILEADSTTPRVQSEGGRIDWDAGGRSELINRGKSPARRAPVSFVDFVPGAAMLVRRAVFAEVGLLPEDFFMYFEETEFCVRAAAAGWRIAVEPSAEILHRFAPLSGLPTETLVYYFVRNRLLFGLRHTEVALPELVADVESFVASWRRRVAEHDPDDLERFDELVVMAVDDARAGVTGRKAGIGRG